MYGKNKYRKNLQEIFLLYIKGEMSDTERNSFEKELQKDPFAEEANEGFTTITSTEASKDLSLLKKRLKARTHTRKGIIYYRIAASVAVLMVVSTIYIVTQINNNSLNISENIKQKDITKELATADDPTSPSSPIVSPSPASLPTPQKKGSDELPELINSEEKQVAGIKIAEARKAEEEQEEAVQDPEIAIPEISSVSAEEIEVKTVVSEKTMDMARAAGAPARMKSVALRDYVPPKPIVGKDSFDLYLENNTRNPYPDNPEQQAVMASFTVSIDSTILNIQIISTPGEDYSREAIRLIEEGPKWVPGRENGIAIIDEITLSIVFK